MINDPSGGVEARFEVYPTLLDKLKHYSQWINRETIYAITVKKHGLEI